MKYKYIPYNSKLKEKARANRNEMTPAEKIIWNNILRNGTEYKFLRQKPIRNYIVDFYCSELMLVIEIDGDSHFESNEAKDVDIIRTKELEQFGLKIIRYTNQDVYSNIDGVGIDLIEKIKKRKKELSL